MTRKDSNGRLTIDESLEDWILFYEGDVAKIGRLVGTTEDELRDEMEDGTPSVTLSPVFVFIRTAYAARAPQGPVLMTDHGTHRLESAFDLGDGDSACNVFLADFEFVSARPLSSRRHIAARLNEAQRVHAGQIVVPAMEVR